MAKVERKKIELSVKLLPFCSGLIDDLVFLAIIQTLFLVNVKQIDASQINLLGVFGGLASLVVYFVVAKNVERIGHVTAMRIGAIMFVLAAIEYIYAQDFFGLVIASILHHAFVPFATMRNVVLARNLEYLGRSKDYAKIYSHGNLFYAMLTLVAAVISVPLYNIDPYLPMYLTLGLAVMGLILSFLITEAPKREKRQRVVVHEKLGSLAIAGVVMFGIFYAMIDVSQSNSQLFLQGNLYDFLSADQAATMLLIVVLASRIARLLANLTFNYTFQRFSKSMLYVIPVQFAGALALLLYGNYLGTNLTGAIVMAVAFLMIIWPRDRFDSLIKTLILTHVDKKQQAKANLMCYAVKTTCVLIFEFAVAVALMYTSYVPIFSAFLLMIPGILILAWMVSHRLPR